MQVHLYPLFSLMLDFVHMRSGPSACSEVNSGILHPHVADRHAVGTLGKPWLQREAALGRVRQEAREVVDHNVRIDTALPGASEMTPMLC